MGKWYLLEKRNNKNEWVYVFASRNEIINWKTQEKESKKILQIYKVEDKTIILNLIKHISEMTYQ